MATTYHKIVDQDHAVQRRQQWKEQAKVVGFTNGCFDLLHVGHVSYLQQAATQVDHLILGLNSDISVRLLKGSERPIIGQKDRAYLLSALAAISTVVIFDEATPFQLIERLLPDVLIKGGDYLAEEIVGYETVIRHGGRVEVLPFVAGKSTTHIVTQIREQL